ncbi:MAG: ATP-binding protein [bacterium]
MKKIFEKAKEYCRDNVDLVHLETSLEMAKKLIALEGGDEKIIIPAIILHDTGWHLFSFEEEKRVRIPLQMNLSLVDMDLIHKHEVESSIIAEKILSGLNYPKDEKEKIIETIIAHDTRSKPISKEDAIVKDADRLSRYTKEFSSLICQKFGFNEDEFFNYTKSHIEKWFFSEGAKHIAKECVLKRRLNISDAEWSGTIGKFLEVFIKLENEVIKITKENGERLMINIARESVYNLKKTLETYLPSLPKPDLKELQADEKFTSLVFRKLGLSGFIGIIDRKTGHIIFHPDKDVLNLPMKELEEKKRPAKYLYGFWDVFNRALKGEEFYAPYQGMTLQGEIVDKIWYVVPLDIGEFKWALTGTAVYDDFFEPVDILKEDTIQSISRFSGELYNLTRELGEKEEKYRSLVERANDGICIVQDTLLKYVNPQLALITGYSVEEMTNTPFMNYIHPDELAKCVDNYKRRMAGEKFPSIYETAIKHKDGHRVESEFNAGVIMYEGRAADLVFVRDITERKQTQEKLFAAEKLSAIAQIAAEVAHEVKNPLAVVESGIYYLSQILPKEEKAQKIFKQINNAVDRACYYLNNLLAFSRPFKLNMVSIDINEIINSVLENIPPSMTEGIEIKKGLGENLPLIKADIEQIKIVFFNLIKNAIEAMKEKKILEINTKMAEGFVEIGIKDSGMGIAEENIEKLFSPFYTTKAKGTGLGLSVCQKIIAAHNGKIEVESKEKEGTTFVIKLCI